MSEKKIAADDLNKALSALTTLAKGGFAKTETATTKVESMSGESGSTQVYHTGSNSDPGGWAGSSFKEVPENGAGVDSTSNGTDGKVAAMKKSILEKLSQGQPVTPAEFALVKGMFGKKDEDEDEDKKDADDAKKSSIVGPDRAMAKAHDDEAEDKKLIREELAKKDVKKSLVDIAAESAKVQEGFEVSEFLADYATAMSKSLDAMEARLARHIDARLAQLAGEQGSFNKSLAGALSVLGESVSLQAQRIEQVESAPARAPKSATSAAALEKSFGGPAGETLSKADALNAMVDLVQKGQCSASEVVKFESTGSMTPSTRDRVLAHVRGGR